MGLFTIVAGLALIACVLLVLIVLVQNSKGGGLAANFQSSNQVMGVRKTTDFLEKATWTLAIVILVLSLAASMTIPKAEMDEDSMRRSRMHEQVNNMDPSMFTNNFPTSVPTEPAEAPTELPAEPEVD